MATLLGNASIDFYPEEHKDNKHTVLTKKQAAKKKGKYSKYSNPVRSVNYKKEKEPKRKSISGSINAMLSKKNKKTGYKKGSKKTGETFNISGDIDYKGIGGLGLTYEHFKSKGQTDNFTDKFKGKTLGGRIRIPFASGAEGYIDAKRRSGKWNVNAPPYYTGSGKVPPEYTGKAGVRFSFNRGGSVRGRKAVYK